MFCILFLLYYLCSMFIVKKQISENIVALMLLLLTACSQQVEQHRVVLCIPVYGQSLALGEEAERLTDFDSLAAYADGRIVTENLDHHFGYFDNDGFKQWAKKAIGYKKRAYELSVYKMAQVLADHLGKDTLICIFPGGQGATAIAGLSKGAAPYQRFIENIKTAYETAQKKGWDFTVPAICWMQGESDIVDYPSTCYRDMLTQIWKDMNDDILQITHQKDSIPFICYQSNSLSRAEHFKSPNYICRETEVPQTFVELLQDNPYFWASGPTYPYPCVNEKIHIDAEGQQAIGLLAARSVLGILQGSKRYRGLIPTKLESHKDTVIIHFNTSSPLLLDTIQVSKAAHYGFSIVSKDNKDITKDVTIEGTCAKIACSAPPTDCKVRYAVTGDYMKSGNHHGPRGNLRDAQGNWCHQFDTPLRQSVILP